MSIYQFTPHPDVACGEIPFCTWIDGFTEEQLNLIRKIGDELIKNNKGNTASIGLDGKVNEIVRKTSLAWIELNQETEFIYNSLAYIARMLNGQFFDFDLYGFVEHLQYTVYRAGGDHYTWHMDKGMKNSSPRKLSLVLQLSDPSEYEGGDLELMVSPEITKLEKRKGLVYAFPSWVMHRVTPVTKGTRRTLVVWVSGPKFK